MLKLQAIGFLIDCNGIRTHILGNRTLNHLANWPNDWALLGELFRMVHWLCVHIRLWSEPTLCNCLNVKERLARNKQYIWNLIDCNRMQTHNYLIRKRLLNQTGSMFVRITFVYRFASITCQFQARTSLAFITEWRFPLNVHIGFSL